VSAFRVMRTRAGARQSRARIKDGRAHLYVGEHLLTCRALAETPFTIMIITRNWQKRRKTIQINKIAKYLYVTHHAKVCSTAMDYQCRKVITHFCALVQTLHLVVSGWPSAQGGGGAKIAASGYVLEHPHKIFTFFK